MKKPVLSNKNPLALAERLRAACAAVRVKNYPLADLIPLMQECADALDEIAQQQQK